MLRFTGLALALVAVFSLAPLAPGQAGDRSEKHQIKKQKSFEMRSRRADRHDRTRLRIVNRNVVVLKVGKDERRHRRPHAYGTYSGGVNIHWQNGVGQWSYGAMSAEVQSVTVAPSAKIIDAGAIKPGDICDMQAGVCVIRP